MKYERSSRELLVTRDTAARARFLRVKVATAAMVHVLLHSVFGVLKPFHPLSIEVDGVAATLPCRLTAGTHIIEFLGEQVEGEQLFIGGDVGAIEEVEFFASDPYQDVRSGVAECVAGVNTLTFRRVSSANYAVSIDAVLTAEGHAGEKALVVVDYSTRSVTSVQVNCDDSCTVHFTINLIR